MANFSFEEAYGPSTSVAPAPQKVVVQPVPMPLPAASAPAPNPNAALAAAMQTRNATAAAAPVADAPAIPPMPPAPKQQPGEPNASFRARMLDWNKSVEQMKLNRVTEAEKAAREAEKAAREAEKPQVKNEGQGLATGFGMRMKESNAILNAMEDQGITNTGVTRSVVSGVLGAIPAIGEKLEEKTSAAMNVLPSWAGGPSAEQQQVEQARRNFITAVLRKESGAVISPQEFMAEEKKYFPQLGDLAPVVKQKREARDIAIRAMDVQSGNKAPSAQETAPPPSLLKEGHITTFANGQQWSMRNGKAERIK